jgi:hypothetical protein
MARTALQRLLRTEAHLLSHTAPEQPPSDTGSSDALPESQGAPCGTAHGHAPAGQPITASAVMAACECGRPVVLGTPQGWELVPTSQLSRARRTVSGKTRSALLLVAHSLLPATSHSAQQATKFTHIPSPHLEDLPLEHTGLHGFRIAACCIAGKVCWSSVLGANRPCIFQGTQRRRSVAKCAAAH